MDTLRREDLVDLLRQGGTPCVSLFMPTERTGREIRQNQVRLKNLLVEAEEQLLPILKNRRVVRQFLQPAHEQLEEPSFWDQRGDGLAVFLRPEILRCFRVDRILAESVHVGQHPVVRPLLREIEGHSPFYLLALSQKLVRLFWMEPHAWQELHPRDMPTNMKDALNIVAVDRGSQIHTGGVFAKRKEGAVYHSQRGKGESQKDDLGNFCRMIDEVVVREIERRPAPLMLACVEPLAAIYRQTSHCAHLLEDALLGNPDEQSPTHLHQTSWKLRGEMLEAEKRNASEQLKQRPAERSETSDTRQIVLAAHDGQVEKLFLDPDRPAWGLYLPSERIVDVHDVRASGDRDLMETVVDETLLHDGEIYCLASEELPSPNPMVAVLRY